MKRFFFKQIKYLLLAFIFLILVIFATFGPRSHQRNMADLDRPTPNFTGNLKIITYDASLLDLRVLGTSMYRSSDYVEQRAQIIPRELLKHNADIIALQEVFDKEHIDHFIDELEDAYPYFFFKHNSHLKLNNGLLIFSKYPFVSTSAESQNAKGSFDEWLIADSGVLSAVIALNDQTTLDLVNLHATPGGLLFKGDDDSVIVEREKQLQQALRLAISNNQDKQIILGDINAGPNTSTLNYQYLLKQGFTDAYQQFSSDNELTPKPSWSGDNPLNSLRGMDVNTQQRIDHIFLSQKLMSDSSIVKVERILDEPVVKVGKQMFPPSDHYGIKIELQFSNATTNPSLQDH